MAKRCVGDSHSSSTSFVDRRSRSGCPTTSNASPVSARRMLLMKSHTGFSFLGRMTLFTIAGMQEPGLSRPRHAVAGIDRHPSGLYAQTGRRSAPRGSTDCQPFVSRNLKSWLRGPAAVNTDRSVRGGRMIRVWRRAASKLFENRLYSASYRKYAAQIATPGARSCPRTPTTDGPALPHHDLPSTVLRAARMGSI